MSQKRHFQGTKYLPIGDYVTSFLESSQSVKCLLREEGFFFFKFASTLLENLDIEHPVFKYIVNVSQEFRKVYGAQSADELLFYIHSWSRDVSQLCEMGIPVDNVLQHMEDVLNEIIQFVDTVTLTMSDGISVFSGDINNKMRNQKQGIESSDAYLNIDAGGFVSKKTRMEGDVEAHLKITETNKEQKNFEPDRIDLSTNKYDVTNMSRWVGENKELSRPRKDIEYSEESIHSCVDDSIDKLNDEDDVSWFFNDLDVKSERSNHLPSSESHVNVNETEQSKDNQRYAETNVQFTDSSCQERNVANKENKGSSLKSLSCEGDDGIEIIHLKMKNSVSDKNKGMDEDVSWFFDTSDETSIESIDLANVGDKDVFERVDNSETIIEDLKKLQADISNDIEGMTKLRRLDRNSEFGRYRGDNCDKTKEDIRTSIPVEDDEFDDCFENAVDKKVDYVVDGTGNNLEDEFGFVEIKFITPAEDAHSVTQSKKMQVHEMENRKKLLQSNVDIISKTVPTHAHINNLDLQQCCHDYNKINLRLSDLGKLETAACSEATETTSTSTIPVTTESFHQVTGGLELSLNKNKTLSGEHCAGEDNCVTGTVEEQKCDSVVTSFECDLKSSASQIKGINALLQTLRKSETEQHLEEIKSLPACTSELPETTIDTQSDSGLVSDECSNQIKGINALLERIKLQKVIKEQKVINGQDEVKSGGLLDGNTLETGLNNEGKSAINSNMTTTAETETKDTDDSFSQKLDRPHIRYENITQEACSCSRKPCKDSCKLKCPNCDNDPFNLPMPEFEDTSNIRDLSTALNDVGELTRCDVTFPRTGTSRTRILTRSRHMKSEESMNENLGNTEINNEEKYSEDARAGTRSKLSFHSRHFNDTNTDLSDVIDKFPWQPNDTGKLSAMKTTRTCIEQLVNSIYYRGEQTINKAVCDVIEKHSNSGKLRLDCNVVASHSMVGAYSSPYVVDGVVVLTSISNTLALHKLHGRSCRALLVNGDIQISFKHKGYKPTKSSQISSLSMFMSELPKSEQWLKEIFEVLENLSVNVLFVKGKVSTDMSCVCESVNILVLEMVPYKQLLQLSEAAQVDMLTYVALATELNLVDIANVEPLKQDWYDLNTTESHNQEVVVVLHRDNPLTVIIRECTSVQADLKDQELWDCLRKIAVMLESKILLPGIGKTEEKCVAFIDRCIKNTKMDVTVDHIYQLYKQLVLEKMASTFQDFIHLVQNNQLEDIGLTDCHKSKVETWKVAMGTVGVIMKLDYLIITGLTDNLNEGTL